MSYKRNIASNFTVQIVRIIIGFVISIIAARTLGAQGWGYISYLILVFGLISSYGHYGIVNAATYYQKRSNYTQSEVLKVNLTFILFNTLFISILIFLLRSFNLILSYYPFFLILEGIFLLFVSSTSTLTHLFYVGNERISRSNLFLIISELTKFAFILLAKIVGFLNTSVYFTILIFSIAIYALLMQVNLGIKFSFKINFKLLKKEYFYGIFPYFAALFSYLNHYIDQFLIKEMLDLSQLGIYVLAVQLSGLLLLVPKSISTALVGRLYNLNPNSNKYKISTALTIKFTFYSCIILTLIGFCIAPLLPIIYGESFKDTVNIVYILLTGIIFLAIGQVSYPYFTTQGRPKIYLFFTLLTVLVNILFNILLIPLFGIMGAALASIFSYFIYGMIHIIFFILKEGFFFRDFFIINKNELKLIKNIFTNSFNKLKHFFKHKK